MSFSREVDLVRWFPVAFLASGVFMVTLAGFELTIPVLRVRRLKQYKNAPFFLVGYVEERPCWPLQSPSKGKKKKAKG